MTAGAWVFGYGSLASPTSLARTIGRTVDLATEVTTAHLHGYGRRWNYGSLQLRGSWHHDGRRVVDGLVVSLGLAEAAADGCNGVVVHVSDDELAALDWRERDYERTDVSDRIETDRAIAGPVVTYVPRRSAVERYEQARDDFRAGIRRSYWDLVRGAFADLGDHHLAVYEQTPPPDVPVVDITLSHPVDT